jgi:hydrogenase nickel incorporation protein HypA/HybF
MHEASIVEALLATATAEMHKAGASRIDRVRLRVGPLAGVVAEALDFAFSVLRRDTPAHDANLEIEPARMHMICLDCGADHWLDAFGRPCPACGGPLQWRAGGRELEILQLELS